MKRNGEKREQWLKLLKREGKKKGTMWMPGKSDRVCSEHFVDKVPTCQNPNPVLNMGYDQPPKKKPRRTLFKVPLARSTTGQITETTESETVSSNAVEYVDNEDQADQQLDHSLLLSPTLHEHSYFSLPSNSRCETCTDKSMLPTSYVKKINALTQQVRRLKREKLLSSSRKSTFSWRHIKSDAKMNFYTGISSIAIFNVLFLLLKPYLPSIRYWRGPKHASTTYSKARRSTQRSKLLSHKDEFCLP